MASAHANAPKIITKLEAGSSRANGLERHLEIPYSSRKMAEWPARPKHIYIARQVVVELHFTRMTGIAYCAVHAFYRVFEAKVCFLRLSLAAVAGN